MANRLKLDFSINSTQDRRNFVEQYIQRPEFESKPPTEEELETIANYILWGKDEDGLNITQRGEVQIETKYKTWQRDDTESLDALIEQPTFNEASIRRPTEARTRVTRETFDRKKALAQCPSHLYPVFQDLFQRIDRLELGINFYEFAHGKRKEPPRTELLERFGQDEIDSIEQMASKWNQHKYLKQRHQIVELRREQFTLRDSFVNQILRKSPPEPELEYVEPNFETEIPIFPLGLVNGMVGQMIFKPMEELIPANFEEQDLRKILGFYWSKKEEKRPQLFFDFEDLEHVYELFGQLEELEESAPINPDSNLGQLIETLRYYMSQADLTEAQYDILDLKIGKKRNQEIADFVNKKHGKSYTANYISTIFRQKIIPKINEAVTFHSKIIENLSFPENFKKCSGCGKVLLIDAENFVRKARSKDGFASKCKNCDRADRQRRKEQKEKK